VECTFGQAATQGDRAGEQHGKCAQGEEREAEHAREVDLEGWDRVSLVSGIQCPWGSLLDASRTSGLRRAAIMVGDAMRGTACTTDHAAVP
jgi:hypothetical protein